MGGAERSTASTARLCSTSEPPAEPLTRPAGTGMALRALLEQHRHLARDKTHTAQQRREDGSASAPARHPCRFPRTHRYAELKGFPKTSQPSSGTASSGDGDGSDVTSAGCRGPTAHRAAPRPRLRPRAAPVSGIRPTPGPPLRARAPAPPGSAGPGLPPEPAARTATKARRRHPPLLLHCAAAGRAQRPGPGMAASGRPRPGAASSGRLRSVASPPRPAAATAAATRAALRLLSASSSSLPPLTASSPLVSGQQRQRGRPAAPPGAGLGAAAAGSALCARGGAAPCGLASRKRRFGTSRRRYPSERASRRAYGNQRLVRGISSCN